MLFDSSAAPPGTASVLHLLTSSPLQGCGEPVCSAFVNGLRCQNCQFMQVSKKKKKTYILQCKMVIYLFFKRLISNSTLDFYIIFASNAWSKCTLHSKALGAVLCRNLHPGIRQVPHNAVNIKDREQCGHLVIGLADIF